MDLKRLRYFIAVASAGSFTAAAKALNMAQPPLSRRIQELEEEVGAPLVDREARPLKLTPAGTLFYQQALQVIQKTEQMNSTMKRFVADKRPRFVIGLVPSGFHARLPSVVRRFRLMAPDVDLKLVEMVSVEQVAALKDGRIDAGLGRVRLDALGIRREILREEPMLIAAPPGTQLGKGDSPVDLNALRELPLIIYPGEPRPSFADHILSLFDDHGVGIPEIIEVRELQTALILVAAGYGACVVPASARLLAHPDVLFHSVLQGVTSPIILMQRAGDNSRELNFLLRTFVELYTEWGFPVPQSLSERVNEVTISASAPTP